VASETATVLATAAMETTNYTVRLSLQDFNTYDSEKQEQKNWGYYRNIRTVIRIYGN